MPKYSIPKKSIPMLDRASSASVVSEAKMIRGSSLGKELGPTEMLLYRGEKGSAVMYAAMNDVTPNSYKKRGAGENTMTDELEGAIAYSFGIDKNYDGQIAGIVLDTEKFKSLQDQGIVVNKTDLTRKVGEKGQVLNFQIKKGHYDKFQEAVKGVYIMDKGKLAFAPTKMQVRKGISGTELLTPSVTRASSDPLSSMPAQQRNQLQLQVDNIPTEMEGFIKQRFETREQQALEHQLGAMNLGANPTQPQSGMSGAGGGGGWVNPANAAQQQQQQQPAYQQFLAAQQQQQGNSMAVLATQLQMHENQLATLHPKQKENIEKFQAVMMTHDKGVDVAYNELRSQFYEAEMLNQTTEFDLSTAHRGASIGTALSKELENHQQQNTGGGKMRMA